MSALIAVLCSIGFLASLNLIATLAIVHRLFGVTEEQRGEDAAQAAMDDEAEAEREAQRRESENSASFDEGIANIMSYAVRGKTGFEND